ncbi:CPBP family intramembrane metalloprotease [Riemerella anatipestifer]|nr:CPBP family intramembrane metalloprotease [Riemerella anatipestifer]
MFYSFFLTVLLVPFFEELIFRYLLRYKKFKLKLINRLIWNRIFPYLVYFLAISFGIIHISNYENKSTLFFLLSPLIVLSQLFGGFVITFIRVRINFIWGCLYHFIWNFIFIIFLPIAESYFSNPFEDITPEYKVTIIEKPFFNKDENQILKIDSLKTKVKKIEVKQYSLQHLLDTMYYKDKYYVDDVLINLDFNSVDYITKEEFLKILKKNYEIE